MSTETMHVKVATVLNARTLLLVTTCFALTLPLGNAFSQEQKTETAKPLTLSQKLAVLVYRTDNLVGGREKMVEGIAELDPKLRKTVCAATSTLIRADVVERMNEYAQELLRRETELTDQERASLAAVRPKLATLEPGKPFC